MTQSEAETLLAENDLPSGWVPVEATAYPYVTNSPLIRLLLEEDGCRRLFRLS